MSASRWQRWVALCSRREDVLSLSLARIVAAGTVFLHLVHMHYEHIWQATWVWRREGGVHDLAPLAFDGVFAPTHANVGKLVFAAAMSALFACVGLLTPVSVVLTWYLFDRLARINGYFGSSPDQLLVNILFLLMLSGCGRALSIDHWLASRGGLWARLFWFARERTALAWPRYVLIGQAVLLYWASGIQKISVGWIPGGPMDALWFVLQQPTWQRFPMRWVAPLYPLTQVATVVTWCWEVSAPVLLLAYYYRATPERPGRVRAWFNRWDVRRWYLLYGLLFHLGIELSMEIGPFLGGACALYACCFAPWEWTAAAGRVRSLVLRSQAR